MGSGVLAAGTRIFHHKSLVEEQNVDIIVSTTPNLEGYRITSYVGPIVIPTIGAASMMRDWLAGFTDFFGGKSKSYQEVFARFINDGVKEMIRQARDHGANAIVNLRIETTNVTGGKSVLFIILYGTAVIVEKIEPSEPDIEEESDA